MRASRIEASVFRDARKVFSQPRVKALFGPRDNAIDIPQRIVQIERNRLDVSKH
jgi:hypothetical protein